MKRIFIIAVFLASAGLMSCRNLTSYVAAGTEEVSSISCSQEPGSECEEQPVAAPVVDITSPLSIFLLN